MGDEAERQTTRGQQHERVKKGFQDGDKEARNCLGQAFNQSQQAAQVKVTPYTGRAALRRGRLFKERSDVAGRCGPRHPAPPPTDKSATAQRGPTSPLAPIKDPCPRAR